MRRKFSRWPRERPSTAYHRLMGIDACRLKREPQPLGLRPGVGCPLTFRRTAILDLPWRSNYVLIYERRG